MKHTPDPDLLENEGVSICQACYADAEKMVSHPKCPGWYYDLEIHDADFLPTVTKRGSGWVVVGLVKNDKSGTYLNGAFVISSRIIKDLPDNIVQTNTRRYKVFLR